MNSQSEMNLEIYNRMSGAQIRIIARKGIYKVWACRVEDGALREYSIAKLTCSQGALALLQAIAPLPRMSLAQATAAAARDALIQATSAPR